MSLSHYPSLSVLTLVCLSAQGTADVAGGPVGEAAGVVLHHRDLHPGGGRGTLTVEELE